MLRYFMPFTGYPYRGERIDCPVCGSSDHAAIASSDRKMKRLETHLCHACGMFFTNPMPTEAELAAYYAGTYRAEYQFARLKPRKSHTGRKAAEAARRWAEISAVTDLSQPLRFLDFGCGSGELPVHFAERGHDATGFEPGEAYGGHARALASGAGRCVIHGGRWQDMGFAPGSFDVITCLHVLEHLATPVPALQRMREWLAPGGVLLLEVPDMQAYRPKGPMRFHFAHVLGFTTDTLGLAAERAGFGLLTAQRGTSMFLVHADDPRAQPFPRDLAANAARNAAEYGTRPPLGVRVGYHIRRAGRVAANELGIRRKG